ncbi:MAG: sigma-54-dependent Fis family transcriptional regulator [Betaproteobacteria bacterium]|nr:sigma-54-dependent Fis family transcriptional regulator [Betaproteobacteria bacterium]
MLVNASSAPIVRAVWLDPLGDLSATAQAQLLAAGIHVTPVDTLGQLSMALRKAHVLVIRLGDSVELLAEVQTLIQQLGHKSPIICRVDRRHMEVTVDAMRLGALHVLPTDEWSELSWRAAVEPLAQAEVERTKPSYVFADPVSQHLFALAQRVAQTEVTALLVGPTGAGKEVLARVLHECSPRAAGPFVAFNCAALPDNLIEDMLFGHEKGAFTGAHKEHKGLFEQARGGTIFLDELGEMPMHLQAKLLRVLQERKLTRLGGETQIDLNVRLIAATNKDLKQAIINKEFREDLYFRISTFRLQIQPLAKRPGDILPLVRQSLRRLQPDQVIQVSEEAQALLQTYAWPGNVRELENVVQRALVLCNGSVITPAHLLFDEASTEGAAVDASDSSLSFAMSREATQIALPTAHAPAQPSTLAMPQRSEAIEAANLDDAVKAREHEAILVAIQTTVNRTEAAKKLGISPRTLRYKLAQLRERGMNLAFAE